MFYEKRKGFSKNMSTKWEIYTWSKLVTMRCNVLLRNPFVTGGHGHRAWLRLVVLTARSCGRLRLRVGVSFVNTIEMTTVQDDVNTHFDQVSACTTAPSTRAPLTSSRPVFHSSRFYILFFFPLALLPRSRFPTRIIIFWFVGSKHAFLQQKHAFLEQKQKNKPFHHMQHFRIYLCSCSECLSSDTKTHFEWWVPSKKEKKMRNT